MGAHMTTKDSACMAAYAGNEMRFPSRYQTHTNKLISHTDTDIHSHSGSDSIRSRHRREILNLNANMFGLL